MSSIQDIGFATVTSSEESDMRDIVGLFDVAVRDEARSRVERICLAVHALGGDGHAYH